VLSVVIFFPNTTKQEGPVGAVGNRVLCGFPTSLREPARFSCRLPQLGQLQRASVCPPTTKRRPRVPRVRQPVNLNSHINQTVIRGSAADFAVTLKPVFTEDEDGRRLIPARR